MSSANLDNLVRIGQLKREPPRAEEPTETKRNRTGDFEARPEAVEV